MKAPSVSKPPLFLQPRAVKEVPLRRLVDRKFVLAIIAAILATAFFLLYGDPFLLPPRKTVPDWLLEIGRWITRLGDGGLLLWPSGILIILLFAIQRLRLTRLVHATVASLIVRLTLVFWAVAIPGLIAAISKGLIGRTRPKYLHGDGTLGFDPLAWKAAAASFPSGHTTVAFASAVILGTLFPRFRIPLFALAVLTGISRILLRVHYPSDAIAGATLGIVFATLVIRAYAARRLSLAVTSDGTIKPKPMPFGRLVALAAVVLATLRGRVPARPLVRSGEIFERN